MEQLLLEQLLLEQQPLEQLLLEQLLLEQQLLEYSYNHFKGLKRVFNSNIYKSIKLNRFRLLAMLERLKSTINKIFILKGYKNILILKIIIKIIVLIRNNN